MKSYTISKLARSFGLSRSTLLYYDRIRLLPASGRTGSGYRYYSEKDYARLERICTFRQAGLGLAQIRTLLSPGRKPFTHILEQRLREIADQMLDLKSQQRLLLEMVKRPTGENLRPVDKALWVEMLQAAGMDDRAMACWHAEFECRAPQAHHEFLASLGIPELEIRRIRTWSIKGQAPAA